MGNIYSAFVEGLPPKPQYDPQRDIPDLSGKVALVTGGNAGIGLETSKWLLRKNAKVYIAARSAAKAQEAITKLKEETGKTAYFLQLDLANINSVGKSAEKFMSQEPELHILYNNGGVMYPAIELLTSDGYDLQFGTNTLGHAIFTLSLLPVLLATAKSTPGGKVRVVNVASSAAYVAPPQGIVWESLKDTEERKKLGTQTLYGQSKFGNVVFSNELARRYADQGIVSVALNPGNIQTNLWQNVGGGFRSFLDSFWLHPIERGVLTSLWAGTSPEEADLNGKYLIPWARVGVGRVDAKNPELGTKLWEWIEEQRKQAQDRVV